VRYLTIGNQLVELTLGDEHNLKILHCRFVSIKVLRIEIAMSMLKKEMFLEVDVDLK